jgi:hypothetical protein
MTPKEWVHGWSKQEKDKTHLKHSTVPESKLALTERTQEQTWKAKARMMWATKC